VTDDALRFAIRRLAAGASLSFDETVLAFDAVMSGVATPAQVSALLMGLRVKGETPLEVAGAATALRRAMVHLPVREPDLLVDTCGTGGGALSTFNISTAAAILAAACGVRVAKHGNRSFTSRSGSADVLEALGVQIDMTPTAMVEMLDRCGIVFMFAPLMHPAMRHVGPVRRELSIPTVMNIVGPLANPASAGRQVVGVADRGRMDLIAGALQQLGSTHALVVHGEPGLDEISPLGLTHVREVRAHTEPRAWTIDPAEHGYRGLDPTALAGGEPAENAATVERVLQGGGSREAEAAVVLNAAAALLVTADAPTLGDAIATARAALRDGRASAVLAAMRYRQ
jgi:anthranilate phosphoribosyltransferase